jgi:uncharacterized protein YciI
MLWMITCICGPNAKAGRTAGRADHGPYLKARDAMVFYAGPLLADDGEGNVGNVYIIDAPSKAEAQAFADNEPFVKHGAFSSVTVQRTRKGRFNAKVLDIDPGPAKGE